MTSKKKYNEIIIPKNTLLFRYAENKKAYPILRFGFCAVSAAMIAPKDNDVIQIWVTKEDIHGVYFVSKILDNGSKINATDDAFKSLMGIKICPLCVPLDENPGREVFISKLKKSYGICSWVTSVISGREMELVLFASKNNNYVKFHSSFKDDCLTIPDEQWNLYKTKSFRHRNFTGYYFNI